MTNRIGKKERKTKEVDIIIKILLDEPGEYQIAISAEKEWSGCDENFKH